MAANAKALDGLKPTGLVTFGVPADNRGGRTTRSVRRLMDILHGDDPREGGPHRSPDVVSMPVRFMFLREKWALSVALAHFVGEPIGQTCYACDWTLSYFTGVSSHGAMLYQCLHCNREFYG